ncbi:hypothetical protein [Emticicia agri]|uniref:Zinc-finger domain-containing protein n=1 Tax=Emticicia agri TaxID=2492393 RepID=A0A4V1ZCX9_9BACT|nr:hypothetical protein [Emticicia agri]RYU94220.1 hypothetical protein EWM59_18145 [Emticicia agri]
MKNKHLTDEEIQLYALDADACAPALVAHIQHCAHCQQEVLTYQLLAEGIKTQEKAVFDFDLADLVMEQLPQPKPTSDRPILYMIGGIMAVMIVVMGELFGSSFIGLFAYAQPILIGLVLTATIALTAFLGIDMYQKYKAQMKALNYY